MRSNGHDSVGRRRHLEPVRLGRFDDCLEAQRRVVGRDGQRR